MIGYIIILIIIGIIVSIITEQMLIRRLRLEEGKCVLKPGYGLLPIPNTSNPTSEIRHYEGIGRNNLTDNELNNLFKPLK